MVRKPLQSLGRGSINPPWGIGCGEGVGKGKAVGASKLTAFSCVREALVKEQREETPAGKCGEEDVGESHRYEENVETAGVPLRRYT
jgi:hypothetical protein